MSMIGPYDPYSLFRKRNDVERIDDFLTKNTSIWGRTLIRGEGEVVVELDFPLWFIERPNFTYGGELDEGQFIEDTHFPTISGIIEKWKMKKEERLGGGYFVGAHVIVVTSGKSNQNIWLHWRFEGKALKNPLQED